MGKPLFNAEMMKPAIVEIVVAALLVVGLLTFAGPCGVHDDGTVSPCFGTSHVLVALGAVACLVGVVRLFNLGAGVYKVLAACIGLIGLAIAVLPGNVLGLCMMATMRCHAIMRPFAIAMGVALVVVACVDLFLIRRYEKPTMGRLKGR